MPTANEKLSDAFTSQQHLLEQYKNEVTATLLLFFKKMEKDIQKLITIEYDEENPLQKDKSVLYKKIKNLQEIELNKLKAQLIKDAEKVLGVSADLYKDQLDKAFDGFEVKIHRVADDQLKKDFEKSKLSFEDGKFYTITAFWNTFYDSVRGRTLQNVESAYYSGKKKKDFIDDLNTGFKVNEGQLDAVSRTLIENAWILGLVAMNSANQSIINGYQYNAILDERTSDICRSLSGGVFIEGHPEISDLEYKYIPPLHWRCRSFITPITKSWAELGLNPENLTEADKEYLSGAIPDKQTYYQWFEKQSASTKKEILGVTRYNAYANGSMKVESFYNSGKKINIETLRTKGYNI